MSIKAFFPQSLKNIYHGLTAVLAVVINGFPARKFTVIGVTGTDGKTTTSSLIYQILKTAGFKTALISTVGAITYEKSLDTGFHVTTPDPFKLQHLLKVYKNQRITHIVLEATSHGLDQHRLLGTNISLGVVTNVTPEHLDYHHTFNRYLKAKAKIFNHAKTVILNADDPAYPKLKSYVKPKTRLVTYSGQKLGQFRSAVEKIFPQTYNQANAAAAISTAYALKIKKPKIYKALAEFAGVPGRLQVIPNSHGINVIVDFAHTPNALENVLNALKTKTGGRLIAVFGAAGERDPFKRPQMGEIGARLADEVVLTSEDPRHEPVRLILKQMLDGVKQNIGHVHTIIDRQEAINFAIIKLARRGDTVGIFGKGHEPSLNLDGRHEIPWSDVKAAQKSLESI